MSANRVEYHQDAIADIKSAVTWYQKRSSKAALDFIAELNRAIDGQPRRSVKPRNAGQAEKTIPGASCFGATLSQLFIQKKSPQSQSGPSLMAVDGRSIGHLASNPC